MARLLLLIWIICSFSILSCWQVRSEKNLSKVEINPNLADDFFTSKAYSRTPSSMQVSRNDTLELDTIYALITEKEVNAFLEDQYNKKFGLDICVGTVMNYTVLIEFRNDLMEEYVLSIKISKDYFKSSYTENNTIANSWTPGKERLVLNNMNFKNGQLVNGRLEIEFVLIENGVKKDSALFHGPFYYKVSVPPVVRSVPAQ